MYQSSAPLDHQLAEKQQQLRHLEKVAARYGYEARFDIISELEAVRRDVAVLVQTLRSLDPSHQEILLTLHDSTPAVQAALRSQIAEHSTRLQEALRIVEDEVVYLPEFLQTTIRDRLEATQAAVAEHTPQWSTQQSAPDCPVADLRATLRTIWQFHASLHLLELREIHRRRLSLMERQQVAHQLMLPSGALQQALEADIRLSQQAIATIKRQRQQTPQDQDLLSP